MSVYKSLTFTTIDHRNIEWLDNIIAVYAQMDESDDTGITLCNKFAFHELKKIRLHLLDNREFPELQDPDILPFRECAEIVVSYLRTSDEFIQGGYLYVLHEFVYPVTKYYYSLIPQATGESFMEFLVDRLEDENRMDMLIAPVVILHNRGILG